MQENRFYVYQHRLVSDGSLILIGHGTGGRARSKCGRNKAWNTITKDNKWYSMLVKDGMTKVDAENLEVELINICNAPGNTHKTNLSAKPLVTTEIDRKFYYDETSPSGLRWKVNSRGSRGFIKIGDVAGTAYNNKQQSKRYLVPVLGKKVYAHRVVWYLSTGHDPSEVGMVIDHVDGNPLNNSFSNLRKVTVAENNRNIKFREDNKTGYKGVSEEGSYFVAAWTTGTERKQKKFSCVKYGKGLALALAIEYRYREIKKQGEIGRLFTERHTGAYEKPKELLYFSEDEIQDMFKCKLSARNKAGFSGVSHYTSRSCPSWAFIDSNQKARTFPILKHGDALAKALAIEYGKRFNGEEPTNVEGYSLKETNDMLNDTTRNGNKSGITGLSFITRNNQQIVLAQKTINYKNFGKRFSIDKLGLLEAIALAIRWRDSMKK